MKKKRAPRNKTITLSEKGIPLFVEHFLGTVAELLEEIPKMSVLGAESKKPLRKKTWGDGLYLVFQNVEDAGNFALELSRRMSQTNWAEKGLREYMNLRIALHAGPV